jgi:hypothetical protein
MIQGAQPLVLLTEKTCRPLLSTSRDKVVCLDTDWPMLSQETGDIRRRSLVPRILPTHVHFGLHRQAERRSDSSSRPGQLPVVGDQNLRSRVRALGSNSHIHLFRSNGHEPFHDPAGWRQSGAVAGGRRRTETCWPPFCALEAVASSRSRRPTSNCSARR